MKAAPKKRRSAPSRETVSDRLRAIIRARGLTACQVAHDAGVNPSLVSRFMAGERGLTTPSLDAVCLSLGLELRENRRGRSATSATPTRASS